MDGDKHQEDHELPEHVKALTRLANLFKLLHVILHLRVVLLFYLLALIFDLSHELVLCLGLLPQLCEVVLQCLVETVLLVVSVDLRAAADKKVAQLSEVDFEVCQEDARHRFVQEPSSFAEVVVSLDYRGFVEIHDKVAKKENRQVEAHCRELRVCLVHDRVVNIAEDSPVVVKCGIRKRADLGCVLPENKVKTNRHASKCRADDERVRK